MGTRGDELKVRVCPYAELFSDAVLLGSIEFSVIDVLRLEWEKKPSGVSWVGGDRGVTGDDFKAGGATSTLDLALSSI